MTRKADRHMVISVARMYGHAVRHLHEPAKGYRNYSYCLETTDGRLLNIIIYKCEPEILSRIKNANYVGDFLAERGMPARRTADTRIAKLTGECIEKYAALYEYLPGKTIPWEAYTMDHIKQLGKAMSDMHALLKKLPQGNLPSVADECRALLGRMEQYFADDGVCDAMARKLGLAIGSNIARFTRILDAVSNLPSQPLHMDFVRSNILFDEHEKAKITGILDFEKAAWGPPIFDIARTLAFLIIDCKYKEERKVRKYFLHSGYNKRGLSSFTPTPLLEHLLNFFLLYDFYKFLHHNPYESLEQNEHFIRTRDFLLNRNILAKT